jgi:hypothetical protein
MKFAAIHILLILYAGYCVSQDHDRRIKIINIDGKDVKVTSDADPQFYGKFTGAKGGYLLLKDDGTGEYLYDYFGFATASCKPGPIYFNWGFLVDKDNHIIRFQREYGYSYPVVYVSTGETSFQGCRKSTFLDYLLYLSDGTIEVSSSDDWKKIP